MRNIPRIPGLATCKRYTTLSPVAAPKAMVGASLCFLSIIFRAVPPESKMKPSSDAPVLIQLPHIGPIMDVYAKLPGPYSTSGLSLCIYAGCCYYLRPLLSLLRQVAQPCLVIGRHLYPFCAFWNREPFFGSVQKRNAEC